MTPEKEILLFEKGLTGRYAHLRPLCLFDRNTGLRFGELSRLEWDHFNLDADITDDYTHSTIEMSAVPWLGFAQHGVKIGPKTKKCLAKVWQAPKKRKLMERRKS